MLLAEWFIFQWTGAHRFSAIESMSERKERCLKTGIEISHGNHSYIDKKFYQT